MTDEARALQKLIERETNDLNEAEAWLEKEDAAGNLPYGAWVAMKFGISELKQRISCDTLLFNTMD